MVNGESEYPIGSCHTQTKLDFSANSPEIQEQNKKKGDRNEFLTAAEWTSSIRLRRLLLSLLFFLTQDSAAYFTFSKFFDFPRFFPEKRKTKKYDTGPFNINGPFAHKPKLINTPFPISIAYKD